MLYSTTHLYQVLEDVFTRSLLHFDVDGANRNQEVTRGRSNGRSLNTMLLAHEGLRYKGEMSTHPQHEYKLAVYEYTTLTLSLSPTT